MLLVAQFLAQKLVNFASLFDSFIVSFSKLLKFDFECKHGKIETAFRAQKVTNKKLAPGPLSVGQVRLEILLLCP